MKFLTQKMEKFVNTEKIWSNDVYSENGNLLLDYSGETLNSRLEYNKID